jgi:CheY-like chemotaxis protein
MSRSGAPWPNTPLKFNAAPPMSAEGAAGQRSTCDQDRAVRLAFSPSPSSSAPSDASHALVLLGFSAGGGFERRQLETVFRLGAGRGVRYRLVDAPEAASLAVVDGDEASAVARWQTLPALAAMSVWVGATAPASAAATGLPRPIAVAQVVRALDALVRRGPPPTAPVQRVLNELAQVARVAPDRPRATVLLATADEQGARSLTLQLERAGCAVLRARSGAEAIERSERAQSALRAQGLHLVLLDAELDGVDGYHACRTLKRRAGALGQPAPRVAIVSAAAPGAAAVGRVRAEMAGADALLAQPFSATDVLALLPIIGACNTAEPISRSKGSLSPTASDVT